MNAPLPLDDRDGRSRAASAAAVSAKRRQPHRTPFAAAGASSNYLQWQPFDMANGPGVRVSVFFAGCSLHCPGCWNPESWNPRNGTPFTAGVEARIVAALAHPAVRGLSVLGGEPFENLAAVEHLLGHARREMSERAASSAHGGVAQDIWIWSGHTFDELVCSSANHRVLDLVDVLVDGPFIRSQRDLTLQFRGSRNQRIIDVPASLHAGHAIMMQDATESGRGLR